MFCRLSRIINNYENHRKTVKRYLVIKGMYYLSTLLHITGFVVFYLYLVLRTNVLKGLINDWHI